MRVMCPWSTSTITRKWPSRISLSPMADVILDCVLCDYCILCTYILLMHWSIIQVWWMGWSCYIAGSCWQGVKIFCYLTLFKAFITPKNPFSCNKAPCCIWYLSKRWCLCSFYFLSNYKWTWHFLHPNFSQFGKFHYCSARQFCHCG